MLDAAVFESSQIAALADSDSPLEGDCRHSRAGMNSTGPLPSRPGFFFGI
jgi:hypothetical protein